MSTDRNVCATGAESVPPAMVAQTFLSVPKGCNWMEEPELKVRHRNLPHWRLDGSTYFVTFRVLAGELNPEERELVFRHILSGDGKFYELLAVVVIPDHVHVVLRPL